MTDAPSPRVGVVILNFGDPTDTLDCLASLERSDVDTHVVVVDNGPEGDAHQRLAAAVGARATVLASGDNLGYAAGNNVGIRHLLGHGVEFVLILNPDTIVASSTVRLLVEHMDRTPDCGAVGPRVVTQDGRIQSDGGRIDPDGFVGNRFGGTPTAFVEAEVVDVDYVPGSALMARAAACEAVGLIPEEYFLYFEETDWCQQLRRAGWRVMVEAHAVVMHHKRSGSLLPTPYFVYYFTRSWYRFATGVLGFSHEEAAQRIAAAFHPKLRQNVSQNAPEWLPVFDDLVRRAELDAKAGLVGRNDAIASSPRAPETIATEQPLAKPRQALWRRPSSRTDWEAEHNRERTGELTSVVMKAGSDAGVVAEVLREVEVAFAGEPHEIVLVACGLSRSVTSRVASVGPLRIIKESHPQSFSVAANRGFAATSGARVVILDADVKTKAASLLALVGALETADLATDATGPDRARMFAIRADTFASVGGLDPLMRDELEVADLVRRLTYADPSVAIAPVREAKTDLTLRPAPPRDAESWAEFGRRYGREATFALRERE